jgi:hypothetical protein
LPLQIPPYNKYILIKNFKEKNSVKIEIMKKNQIEILKMESPITRILKNQLKALLIEWNKVKIE